MCGMVGAGVRYGRGGMCGVVGAECAVWSRRVCVMVGLKCEVRGLDGVQGGGLAYRRLFSCWTRSSMAAGCGAASLLSSSTSDHELLRFCLASVTPSPSSVGWRRLSVGCTVWYGDSPGCRPHRRTVSRHQPVTLSHSHSQSQSQSVTVTVSHSHSQSQSQSVSHTHSHSHSPKHGATWHDGHTLKLIRGSQPPVFLNIHKGDKAIKFRCTRNYTGKFISKHTTAVGTYMYIYCQEKMPN